MMEERYLVFVAEKAKIFSHGTVTENLDSVLTMVKELFEADVDGIYIEKYTRASKEVLDFLRERLIVAEDK